MAYNSYFDEKYGNMQKDYQPDVAVPAQQPDGLASGLSGSGASGAAMSSGNPYAMGGAFLVNYLAQKAKAFEAKKQQEMALAQNYANNQEQGLGQLGSYWSKALKR